MKKRAYADDRRKDPQIFFGIHLLDQREFSVQISVKKGFTQIITEKTRRFYLAYIPLISEKKSLFSQSRKNLDVLFCDAIP